MAVKYFNAGSALMAIFIFVITGLFSWFGSETINNSKQSISTIQVLKRVDYTMGVLNKTLEKVSKHEEENEKLARENSRSLYKLTLDVAELKGNQ